MNSTFTREDENDATVDIKEETEVFSDAPQTIERPARPAAAQEAREPETLLGYTRAEIIVLKHTSKLLTEQVGRLLYSNEFEVRRCANGEVISQGRCQTPVNGALNGATGASSEELQKALKDRDLARAEAEKLHANYATLFASYNQVREVANDIRNEYEDARDKLKMAVAEVDEWQNKFLAVKDNANAELERASIEYDELVSNHENNMKGLRLRVKRHDIEIASKDEEIRVLKKRVEELSSICDQLIEDVDLSDQMSQVSMDA
ncbi:unnamed protein product [Caenorhabditis nigoni]|uniref:Transforming acidic coiled-coil-containing protein C-terminal domain-containing protein n=1 Tax=Caenorhabditis nigoni TaxID=1611254 RepID=A0A2G5UZ74_9PELO|nr:hypothetical protein B9Z55_005059 [Caenorhabditis nigoni]